MTTERSHDAGPEYDWSWTEDDADWVPPDIDTTRPSSARMYDYALGGKDNFAVDRAAVEKIARLFPDYRQLAQANRGFLVRAVQHMAAQGLTQYVDLGTGIPTSPNVYEVANAAHPSPKVVYIDNDPMVMAHNRALRKAIDGVITLAHDLRQPAAILSDPAVRNLIDLSQPVGVLMVAVLHFVRRDVAPGIVAHFARALAPGSHVAISAVCTDGMSDEAIRMLEGIFANATAPLVLRTRSQIEQLFDGLELVEPGITDVATWRADGPIGSVRVLAGVGRKPSGATPRD